MIFLQKFKNSKKKLTSNVTGGGNRLTSSVTAGGKGKTPPANECNPGTKLE